MKGKKISTSKDKIKFRRLKLSEIKTKRTIGDIRKDLQAVTNFFRKRSIRIRIDDAAGCLCRKVSCK